MFLSRWWRKRTTTQPRSCKLQQGAPGDRARVLHLHNVAPGTKARLMAMGLLPGTEITIENMVPMGGPLVLRLRGFVLSLRSQEAQALHVEWL